MQHVTIHNLNALPHALPYILFESCLVLGYLQRVTSRSHQFFLLNINTCIFYKFGGNALEIAPKHVKLREYVW